VKRRAFVGKPLDSFPFLSGDSFFFSCEFFYLNDEVLKVPVREDRPQKNLSLFLKVGAVDKFIEYLWRNSDLDFSSFSLVIHNGDDEISLLTLEKLLARFKKIYAVNLLVRTERLIPIPIGLENHNHFTNGVPKDFNRIIDAGLKPFTARKVRLLESFSIHTNTSEREACSKVGKSLGSVRLIQALPSDYRKTLAESKFVLSPSGNGMDCHRTWEALYLGAVPIVRRANWSFANRSLPVLVINEWADLLNFNLETFVHSGENSWSDIFWSDFFKG
jgi:hypothetical protein